MKAGIQGNWKFWAWPRYVYVQADSLPEAYARAKELLGKHPTEFKFECFTRHLSGNDYLIVRTHEHH